MPGDNYVAELRCTFNTCWCTGSGVHRGYGYGDKSSQNLFEVLDQALQGQVVEITYKGSKLRLTPVEGGSKLSRAVRRHSLMVDPQFIVKSDSAHMAELEKGWRSDDNAL